MHIAHSSTFKGARPKQPKTRGRGKGKQPQQKTKPPPVQVQEDQYTYDDTNNCYHNENYRGQPRAVDLIEAKILDDFSEVKICMVEVNAVKIHTKANNRVTSTKVIITKAIMVYMSCVTKTAFFPCELT